MSCTPPPPTWASTTWRSCYSTGRERPRLRARDLIRQLRARRVAAGAVGGGDDDAEVEADVVGVDEEIRRVGRTVDIDAGPKVPAVAAPLPLLGDLRSREAGPRAG